MRSDIPCKPDLRLNIPKYSCRQAPLSGAGLATKGNVGLRPGLHGAGASQVTHFGIHCTAVSG